ncbi:hypothetical protein Ddye_024464 [Dipteronia dyeriana]|uniref:ABC transmembrane type-1 domain-containing protein n=1 Tax=Dipteronia dyeriana TaxID=168575 RepID=A0AAD9TV18_9ROSI|nr:hypothetical protein Ddye_024464 [Dipteronia dyeriana]
MLSLSSKNVQARYEEASLVANEAIGGMRTVASFCVEKKLMNLYQKKIEAPMKQGVQLHYSCYLSSYSHGPDTNKANVSVASILEIPDIKSKIDSSSNKGTTLSNVDGDIEFERQLQISKSSKCSNS